MNFICVNKNISLSEITLNDVDSLLEYLNDPDIYKNTLSIPYPYKAEDGNRFINFVKETKKKTGKIVNWAN